MERCGSRSALKISQLCSRTACFNPRSLSENNNHMNQPYAAFYSRFSPSFCSRPVDKSNSETPTLPVFFCLILHTGHRFSTGRHGVCYIRVCGLLRMAAMRKPDKQVSFLTRVLQTPQHKFTSKSACLHKFWLTETNSPLGRGHRKCFTVERLRTSRWVRKCKRVSSRPMLQNNLL